MAVAMQVQHGPGWVITAVGHFGISVVTNQVTFCAGHPGLTHFKIYPGLTWIGSRANQLINLKMCMSNS